MNQNASPFEQGMEWVVDAHGCATESLRSEEAIRALMDRAIREIGLHVVGEPMVHVFPDPGGITALFLLSESHLSIHTFPENGFCAIDLYCCRPRSRWPWEERVAEALHAQKVTVRFFQRPEEKIRQI